MTATNTTSAANAASSQLNNDVTVNNKSGKKDSKAMNTHIIGIDHGYKNMKGANTMFPTKLKKLDYKPDEHEMNGIIEYKGSYYSIHENELLTIDLADKTVSNDYYILTLAVLGEEFEKRGIQPGANKIHVRIGCGLPPLWRKEQKDRFRDMILKDKEVRFSYNGKTYNVIIDDAHVFMQGLSALLILDGLSEEIKKGHVIIVDIGGETMDVISCNGLNVDIDECRMDDATISLIKRIPSAIMTEKLGKIHEEYILAFLCSVTASTVVAEKTPESIMKKYVAEYAKSVITQLRQWGVNMEYDNIVFVGGGSRLIKEFSSLGSNVIFCDDININAKGYEFLETALYRQGK